MKDNATFSPLDDDLQIWVLEQLELLTEYSSSLGVSLSDENNAHSLDSLWVAWKAAGITDSKAVDSFLNCFGIGFGQLLINDLGFEWTYLEDEYGSDIAVRALPGVADTRIAPLHFVLKRWESGEERYVEAALVEIDNLVDQQAAEHGVAR